MTIIDSVEELCGQIARLRGEADALRAQITEAAAFLDGLATLLDKHNVGQFPGPLTKAALDCRAMVHCLRGEPPSRNPYGEGDPAEIDGT